MAYDILIKGGTIIDGTGEPAFLADLGIKGDEVSAIGDLKDAGARTRIEASGKYVVPGFVDLTNLSDSHLTIFKYPSMDSLLMQGITTIIGGNCGASLAPLVRPEAIHVVRKWADLSEVNVDWASVAEFLKVVEGLRLGVNFGTFVGYGTLRRGIIGDDSRPLNLEEAERLRDVLTHGLKEGAFGISLGLAYGHERVSTTEEIIDIVRTFHGTGRIVKIHLRSEGRGLMAGVNEAIRISRESQVPVQISHLKAVGEGAWPNLPKVLSFIERAKQSGSDIGYDISPYRSTGSLLYVLIPAWARMGGLTEVFKRINNPSDREKIIDDLKAAKFPYEKLLILSAKSKFVVGKTIADVAYSSNSSPEETMLNLFRLNEGRITISGKAVSLQNVVLEVQDKNSLISSDGAGYSQEAAKTGNLLHPRSFGAFPHFWHRFVKDLKVISPEEAVRKMSSGPASRIGLKNRGSIKKGNFADIAVFDPKIFKDRSTHHFPFRYPAGMEWVVVNGRVAVEQGRLTGVRAGQVVKFS